MFVNATLTEQMHPPPVKKKRLRNIWITMTCMLQEVKSQHIYNQQIPRINTSVLSLAIRSVQPLLSPTVITCIQTTITYSKYAIFANYLPGYLPVARCLLFALALVLLSTCEYFNNMFECYTSFHASHK